MSYASTKRSESSASRRSLDMDATDDDGDESKRRKSRNLSEKKRRDQFNILINDLCSMVTNSTRKIDKSTVLKATITFLKTHNDLSVQSEVEETSEDWKPSFLSNEEFTHVMLESLDGFVIVISSTGQILYLSESVTSLLGYLSRDLINSSIFDYVDEEAKAKLQNVLSCPIEGNGNNNISITLYFQIGGFGTAETPSYQLVRIVGYFKKWISVDCANSDTSIDKIEEETDDVSIDSTSNYVFIATGRLIDAEFLREMSVVVDTTKNEFSSRHSLEWKFLSLDLRAPPIIGYLPFEVLGNSGYDYYHAEDLEKVAKCHETLMKKGEGTSCFYRFLTKGQQWIWLQTRYYITYHQWNSKPEFIVCTHRVVSYADVMKDIRGEIQFSQSTRFGHSTPKIAKMESKKSCIKFSKQKNTTFESSSVSMCPQITTIKVPILPQIPHFLQPQMTQVAQAQQFQPNAMRQVHTTYGMAVPVLSNSSFGHNNNAITSPLQEQLLMKHAALQRQIVQQQEELRCISEQLVMAQCGFVPSDPTTIMSPPVQLTLSESSSIMTSHPS